MTADVGWAQLGEGKFRGVRWWMWDETGPFSGAVILGMFLGSLGFSVYFTSCFTFFSSY